MKELEAAILLAGEELATEHQWCFDGDPGSPPTEENPFFVVLMKHVSPLVNIEEYKAARIAALKAELQSLEESK